MAPAGGAVAAGRRLQIAREPAAFSALAGGSGDLATRAANVLARIEWPGKPGAATPVTPLTAAEQQRFEAGREVYRNICQACHQPDGRGLARVAPPLVGSVLALAPAEVTARILLNGKEGRVGLMPPIGATLTDDQIASGVDLRAARVGTGRRSRRSGDGRGPCAHRRPLAPGRGPTTSC